MNDWQRIITEQNQLVRYAEHQPNYQFALCANGWRNGGSLDPKATALLWFYYEQMCRLYNQYGQANVYGALADFAISHRDYEVWFNGVQL